uniref:F-box domain-containing protein n=1 Tax=Pithovirus LCPAC102 TaxID=2506587 RepID=A0A481Z443_9VIRU|nr:MAG: hypothetical protein LCPAC102_02080 [Pithovirus LCPAC102]
MNLPIYDPLLPSNILNLPVDVQREFLSKITEPSDIISLSKTSGYIRELLRSSVKVLDTLDDILYIHIDWMNYYPELKLVNDNIIFNINLSDYTPDEKNMLHIDIPTHLRKFNIRIYVDDVINYPSYDIQFIIKSILSKMIKVNELEGIIGLNDYTVRFIINFENGTKDIALIIDDGSYGILEDFTTPNRLFKYNINIDWITIFENIKIKIINKNDQDDMNYILNNPHISFLYKYTINYKYLNHIIYPIAIFNDFLTDIYNETGINYFTLFPTYDKYGYISKKMILLIIEKYINYKGLLNNDNYISNTELIKKYFNIKSNKFKLTKYVKRHIINRFNNNDKNKIISHIYLIDIYNMIYLDIIRYKTINID